MSTDLNSIVRALEEERASKAGQERSVYTRLLKAIRDELSGHSTPDELLAMTDRHLLFVPGVGTACLTIWRPHIPAPTH